MLETPAMSKPQFDRCVDYVEFAVRDVSAARHFYHAVFGWNFEDYGPDYTSFHDGRIGGGFFRADPDWRPSGEGAPLVVFYSVDLPAAAERITAAGGRIVKATFEFPGGRRFHFADPNGNQLAIWSDL